MILAAQHIRQRCLQNHLIFPFYERTVVRGRSFGLSSCSYDVRIAESVDVLPQGFVLASTMECFNMPLDLKATPYDKSSWARLGLAVQNTLFDPGWRGYATLELSNHNSNTISLKAGDPICQIVFELLLEPTEQPYQGKYQDQHSGPQPSILETHHEP